MSNQWEIPIALSNRMVQLAREFRKVPTRGESILWQALRGRSLDGIKFRRQQPIGPFVVDFYAPSARLIVEIDGPIHAEKRHLDMQRQQLLESLGLRFIRLPDHLVRTDLQQSLHLIRQSL